MGKCEAQQEWVIYKLKNYKNPDMMNEEEFKKSYTSPPKKKENHNQPTH